MLSPLKHIQMKHLQVFTKQDVLARTKIRRFETKLGECVKVVTDTANLDIALQQTTARYVLVGVQEDVGIKANGGTSNTLPVWPNFLSSFLNLQSNDFFSGEEVLVLGQFDFSDVTDLIEASAATIDEKTDAYRHAVNLLDAEIEQIVQMITQNRKLPIVIGGGGNNAYPCIKGAAKGWLKSSVIPFAQINAIHLGAHTNYASMEGRHSGNALRYAEEDGYLEKFCLLGIHENYIQQNVWIDIVNNPFADCITHEDIFLLEKRTFEQSVITATDFTDDTLVGIELDLDVVASSVPHLHAEAGIDVATARQFLNYVVMDSQPAYLHISEGTYQLAALSGKVISYLVSDFIKAMQATYQSE